MTPYSKACALFALALFSASAVRAEDHDSTFAPVPVAEPGAPALGDSLDLETLLKAVAGRNPSIQVSRAAAAGAEARVRAAGSLPDPEVEFMTAPGSWGNDPYFAYKASIRQRIPSPGTLGSEEDVERHEADALAAGIQSAVLHATHEARLAFIEYSLVDREQTIYKELRTLLEGVHRVALARYSTSQGPIQDALQAEVDLGMLDHETFEIVRRRRQAIAKINTLMHRDAGAALPPARGAGGPPPAPDAAYWLSVQDPRRPEVAQAEARVHAAGARVELAGRARRPELGLELAYDRFWNETPLRGTVGVSLSLPLHRGQISAREDEARAGAAEAEWTLRGLRDQVAFEASDAAARVRESWHELETLDTTVLPTSERAHAAARSRYETGQGDFQATLTVTQSLLRLRLDRERTLSEYLSARADLEYAAGRMPAGAKGE